MRVVEVVQKKEVNFLVTAVLCISRAYVCVYSVKNSDKYGNGKPEVDETLSRSQQHFLV